MVRNQLVSVFSNLKIQNNENNVMYRDPIFFLSIGVAFISFLVALIGDASPQIAFGIGFTLTALLVIFSHYRTSSYDLFLSVTLVFAVLTLGLV
ncbi:MAG: hypothetical protein ACW97X_12695, partial [Candidatus Hodarchaeales archaeon]